MAEQVEDVMRVEATADKALFVSMLVKDIELLPAIMDLIDNSVDGARAVSPGEFARHWVNIETTDGKFTISDNCGGIPLKVARKYAFRFGRPKEHTGVEGSVGQFGVGMKRALFKLGSTFVVESRSDSTAFELKVDVPAWLADEGPDWQFRMSRVEAEYTGERGVGTTITVTDLHDFVREDLRNRLVLGSLREQIRLRHQSSLEQGLRITLDGERLRGFTPELLSAPTFAPLNRRFVIADGDGQVHCQIVAGIAPGQRSDDTRDDGNAEDFRSGGDAGWWVFCNGRLLLFAERSSLTGWGAAVASYHPQYRQFRGYVYLESLDASHLPWNTTKTGVDQDSRVWRRVQNEMKVALVEVVSILNRLKTERQTAESPDEMPLTAAMATATPTVIAKLSHAHSVIAPPVPSKPKVRRARTKKIQYDVDPERFRLAADALEVTTAVDVGRLTFDYFFDREVDES